jgi:hypothetical protein
MPTIERREAIGTDAGLFVQSDGVDQGPVAREVKVTDGGLIDVIVRGQVTAINFGDGLDVTMSADGTTATVSVTPGAGSGINFAENETPGGTINGTNQIFTLAHVPASNALKLFFNGMRLKAGTDFSLSGLTITMITVTPQAGAIPDILLADYRW